MALSSARSTRLRPTFDLVSDCHEKKMLCFMIIDSGSAARMEGIGIWKQQMFDDVFDALSDTPAEAANMKARAELLSALVQRVKSWGLSQEAAAARLGVTRPRLNDLMRGKLGKFSLDALVNLTAAAGLELEIRVKAAA